MYTVANVQSATGEDRYAGWALVVAYEAAGEPPRNLTVFDGLQSVTQGKPALTIPVSGFQTPLSGPVRTKLGFVAYEGDRGLTGDSATLDGKLLSDKVNAANNFFNCAISVDGQNFTGKTPDYVNQLGFDAKLIGIDGLLANGATSATIGLKTSSDQYLPARDHVRHRSLRARDPRDQDRHEPDPSRMAPRVPETGCATRSRLPTRVSSPRPTSSHPTSCRPTRHTSRDRYASRARRPARGTPTDLVGDDQGEYDPAQNAVRFFLGSGAAPGREGCSPSRAHPATPRRSASRPASTTT